MHELRVALTPRLVGLYDAAALVVEGDGTTRVIDTRHGDGTIGGVLGAGLGLLTGGIGWMWLHGRRLGALAARAGDGGLAGGALRTLGERIMPGSSVVLAVAEPARADGVEGALADRGADLVRGVVPEPLARQLAAAPPLTFDPAAYKGDIVGFRAVAPVMRAVGDGGDLHTRPHQALMGASMQIPSGVGSASSSVAPRPGVHRAGRG